MQHSIYTAMGGEPAVRALAEAWHLRCLEDPVVSHAFSHPGHPHHLDRLTAYWAETLGGPARYTDAIASEEFVLRMHSGNGVHEQMDERAISCFLQAMDDAALPRDARLRRTLTEWFRWATKSMSAYPDSPDDVPDGLAMPKWAWSGPIS